MPIKAWLMHIWVFGAAALTAPEAAGAITASCTNYLFFFLARSRCLFVCSWHSIRRWSPRRWPGKTKGAEDTIGPRQIPVGRLPRGSDKAASEPPVVEVIPRGAGRLDLVVVLDQVEPPVVEVIPRGGAPR